MASGDSAIVLDAGPGAVLLDFLQELGVTRIESVVISHADEDHIGGLIALLGSGEVSVDHIYINPDAAKTSDVWSDLAWELNERKLSGSSSVTLGLTAADPVVCTIGDWSLEVLAPSHLMLQLGSGNWDRRGRRIKTNSISVVCRVLQHGHPLALSPGDLDYTGFLDLMDSSPDLTADLLIVPHHGGLCGTASQTDAVLSGLARLSGAKEVFVSHGRSKYENPLPRAVALVRAELPGASFACTQMSTNCLPHLPDGGLPRVSLFASAGSVTGVSCCGTAQFDASGTNLNGPVHMEMITHHAPDRLCR